MNKKAIFSLLITCIISFILAAITVVCLFTYLYMDAKRIQPKANSIAEHNNDEVYLQIYKLKQNEIRQPGNFMINMKIADLYEQGGNYTMAGKEYNKVIVKTKERYLEPIFRIANIYIIQNQYQKAVDVVNRIENTSNLNTIVQKAIFFENLGDILLSKEQYSNALNAYLNSYTYIKRIAGVNTSRLKNSIINCYVGLSEEKMENKDVHQAIAMINKALEYRETAVLYYKLAILYLGVDIHESYKYFQKVQAIDPAIINYTLYKQLLEDLRNESLENSNLMQAKIYELRQRKISRYEQKNIVQPKEVSVEYEKIKLNKSFLGKDNILELHFRLKNNSASDISKLYIYMEVLDSEENQVYEETKEIIKSPKKLISRGISDLFKYEIKLPKETEPDIKGPYNLIIYLAKNKDVDFIRVSRITVK